MKFPFLSLIAFLFLTHSLLYSQEGWRRLTTSDGLSSNSINTIFQTKNGHIWIGTDKGPNRYDGVFEGFRRLNGPLNIIFESSTGQIFARLYEPGGQVGSGILFLVSTFLMV